MTLDELAWLTMTMGLVLVVSVFRHRRTGRDRGRSTAIASYVGGVLLGLAAVMFAR